MTPSHFDTRAALVNCLGWTQKPEPLHLPPSVRYHHQRSRQSCHDRHQSLRQQQSWSSPPPRQPRWKRRFHPLLLCSRRQEHKNNQRHPSPARTHGLSQHSIWCVRVSMRVRVRDRETASSLKATLISLCKTGQSDLMRNNQGRESRECAPPAAQNTR